MRTLIFMRHGQSGAKRWRQSDFERPLTKGGRLEAPMMARVLARRGLRPDLIVSSPAARALATAELVAEAMAFAHQVVRVEPALYDASIDHYLDLIRALPDEARSVLLVGHNPAISECVNALAPSSVADIPPSGVVAVSAKVESWARVRQQCGKLLFYEQPQRQVS